MSIAKLVYVVCDRCGAPAGAVDDMRDDAVSARRRAKELGFTRVGVVSSTGGFEDLCPTCGAP